MNDAGALLAAVAAILLLAYLGISNTTGRCNTDMVMKITDCKADVR